MKNGASEFSMYCFHSGVNRKVNLKARWQDLAKWHLVLTRNVFCVIHLFVIHLILMFSGLHLVYSVWY